MHVNRERFTKSNLVSYLLIFGYFLYITFKSPNFISLHVSLIYFTFALAYIVGNIVQLLAFHFYANRKEFNVDDERDKIIVSKSYRNAHISIIIIINVIIIYFIFYNNILQPAFLFNLLFGTLLISHIVLLLTRAFYYKRGIQ